MNESSQSSLPDFEHMYAAIGRAIWHIQFVEEVLNSLITLKHDVGGPGRVTEGDALGILKKHRRNTLGTSVRIARESNLVDSQLLARLMLLKSERDWLVHRCRQSAGELALSPWGRSDVLRRAAATNSEALSLLPLLVEELRAFIGKGGPALDVSESLEFVLRQSPSGGT